MAKFALNWLDGFAVNQNKVGAYFSKVRCFHVLKIFTSVCIVQCM